MQSKRRCLSIKVIDHMPINANNAPPKGRAKSLISFALLSLIIVGSHPGQAAPPPAGVAPVITPAGGGRLNLEMRDIIDIERPPIASIAAYQTRRLGEVDTPAR